MELRGEISALQRQIQDLTHQVRQGIEPYRPDEPTPPALRSLRDVQAALDDHAERLRSTFDHLDVGVVVLDGDLRYRYVNPEARRCEPEQFAGIEGRHLGEILWERYDPERAQRMLDVFDGVLRTGRPYRHGAWPPDEYALRRGRFYDWSVRRVERADGGVDGLLLTLIDVTAHVRTRIELERLRSELQEAEGRLRRQRDLDRRVLSLAEERLGVAVDYAALGTWELDPVDEELTCSAGWCAIFGLPAQASPAPGDWYALMQADDREALRRDIGRLVEGSQRELARDCRFSRADTGAHRWVSLRARALEVDDRPARILGIAVDVTEHKRRESRDRLLVELGALFGETLDHRAVLATLGGTLVPAFADACVADLVRGDGEERVVVEHDDPRIVALLHELHRRYRPQGDHPLARALTDGCTICFESVDEALLGRLAGDAEHLRMLRDIGLRSLLILPLIARGRVIGRLTLAMTSEGRRFQVDDVEFAESVARAAASAVANAQLFHDVDRARDDLARQAEQLARSNAELEQFAHIAAHDLQEPLRMISNFVDLIQDHGADLDPAVARYFGFVRDGARRMNRMVDGLLEFALASTIDAHPGFVPLDESARQAWHEACPADGDVESGLDLGRLPRVRLDRLRLVQLLRHLFANARKFRAPGRRLAVGVAAEPDGDEWVVTVEDNGIGIDEADGAQLFRLFHRLGRDRPGEGAGLAVCKKIVETYGGRIWIESTPGVGTRIRFTLPRELVSDGTHRPPR